MTPDREERIRQRAHELWEREGRPHGRHDDHWQQAREEIDAEALQMDSMKGVSADPAQDSPAPKRRGRPAKSDAAEAGDQGLKLLEQNYRSTQNILNAANAVISHNFDQVMRLSDQVWVMRAGRCVAGRRTGSE